MKTVDVQLNRLAAGQYSLASRTEALDLGMTSRQLHDRLEAGLFGPVHKRVYRFSGAPPTSDKGNIVLAHGWRVLHFSWFDLTRRARYVVGSVGQQLVLACPA